MIPVTDDNSVEHISNHILYNALHIYNTQHTTHNIRWNMQYMIYGIYNLEPITPDIGCIREHLDLICQLSGLLKEVPCALSLWVLY